MKILWVKTDYLHPTNRGGQIRTLEMLRCLHSRHEVHYLCLDDGINPEGPARSQEYCTRAYPVRHVVPPHRSARFALQLARGLVSSYPVAVARYISIPMRRQIENLLRSQHFDSIVCDFLFPAPNVPGLSRAVLFQHNVEAEIWRRHVEQAGNPFKRRYFGLQAARMRAYEGEVCRKVAHVVAVSDADKQTMRRNYGIENVSSIATGVNLSYFARPADSPQKADIVFVGSMDWLPNIDGAQFFVEQILPRIRRVMPELHVALVGRRPAPAVLQAARSLPYVTVTGTVDDVRPWLWGSALSVVPLRIGGGTRLKIFEAMAAGVPVVSTTIGAEGLPVKSGKHLVIEDDPDRFADSCIQLLQSREHRTQLATEALALVKAQFSWDAVTRVFEDILVHCSEPAKQGHASPAAVI